MGSPTSLSQLSVSETEENFRNLMLREFNLRDIFFFYCTSEENKRLVLREGFPLDSVAILLYCTGSIDTGFYVYKGDDCFQVKIPIDYEPKKVGMTVNEIMTIEGVEHSITRIERGIEIKTSQQFEAIKFFMQVLKLMFHTSSINILTHMQIITKNPGRVYNLACVHPYIESTFEFECENPEVFPIRWNVFKKFNDGWRNHVTKIIHKTTVMTFTLVESSEKDVNLIVKWYLQNDGLNVEKIIINLPQDPENPKPMNWDKVLKDLPTHPGSKKNPSASDFYDNNIKYENGFDVQKFDGAVITITFDANGETVILTIWNTSQPNYIEPVKAEFEGYFNPIAEEVDEWDDEWDAEPEDTKLVNSDDDVPLLGDMTL